MAGRGEASRIKSRKVACNAGGLGVLRGGDKEGRLLVEVVVGQGGFQPQSLVVFKLFTGR